MWTCPICGRSFEKTEQSHFCRKPATVDEYIDLQSQQARPYLQEVRAALRQALPQARETIVWSMPTYREGVNLIHFAASKKHIGLYPGEEAVAAFAEKLAEYDVSKGTIRIPYARPLPLALIQEIARWCRAAHARPEKKK